MMSNPKYFKDISIEGRLQFIKDTLLENYPFNKNDLEDFQDKLDFNKLSANQFIDWDAQLIEKYKDKWDWSAIENNPIICKEVNLGMLYADKVNIIKPKCDCYKMLEFCNQEKHCTSTYDELKLSKIKGQSINPKLFGFIKFLYEDYCFGPSLLNSIFQYNFLIDHFDDYELDNLDVEVKDQDEYNVPF
jgi:hypothetical protein